MGLREIDIEGINCVKMAKYRVQWWALVLCVESSGPITR
jgi:hypothetical protein